MKTKVGLWIDHRKAVIVAVTDKGEEMGLGRIGGMETVDNITDRQIAAKVRKHFQK